MINKRVKVKNILFEGLPQYIFYLNTINNLIIYTKRKYKNVGGGPPSASDSKNLSYKVLSCGCLI